MERDRRRAVNDPATSAKDPEGPFPRDAHREPAEAGFAGVAGGFTLWGGWRLLAGGCASLLLVVLAWLAVTDDVRVWPLRNTAQYRALRRAWDWTGEPQRGAPGSLRGVVRDVQGRPISGARVLVSRWDGTTYSATAAGDGRYVVSGIPAGQYVPVAGAPGYEDALAEWSLLPRWPVLGPLLRRRVVVVAGREVGLDVQLMPERRAAPLPLGQDAMGNVGGIASALTALETVACDAPIPARASRRRLEMSKPAGWLRGRERQTALFYAPVDAAPAAKLPLLITVYPGPADEWECASLPLARAGYIVVAVGPPYSFDLEGDVEHLEWVLRLARGDRLAGVDGSRIAVLGGSYSALHVLRVLERRAEERVFRAAVLLGPPVDLFDMRRRLEDRTFVPPFGLDQALVALGLPDRAPLRYWRHSGVYHVRPNYPPMLLVHSRDDPVVPFQQSEQLANALEAVGVPHELYVFDGAGHYLLSPGGEAEAIYELTVRFLDERLRQ